jgi:hypothetical protein
MRSNHLIGKAFDVVPLAEYFDGRVREVSWDRAPASREVLDELVVKWNVTCGGSRESFPDLPHLEERA